MKKCFTVGVILLFIGTAVIPSNGQEIEKPLMTSRGNWLYVGGSGPGNYTKIQDAINTASTGDTIFIYHDSSPYNENIIINTSLTLLGENQTTTRLDGGSESPTIAVNAPNTVISGLTITQKNSSWVNSNIYLKTNNDTIVGDTLIYGSEGVCCSHCSNITVKNSAISNAKYGLYLCQTSNSFFENNSISSCGIDVDGITCLHCHFFYNDFYDNVLPQGNYSEYKHNTFFRVGLNSQGMYDDDEYNIFVNCGAFIGAYKGTFAHNIIQNTTVGISLSMPMNVSYNTIQNCQLGIEVFHAFFPNISYNNFMNNKLDALFEISFLIRWYGNYWEKPLFRPKIIVGLFWFGYIEWPWINFDFHPARKPYDIPGLT
jgi:nitrous oxidase accessory protein NosD